VQGGLEPFPTQNHAHHPDKILLFGEKREARRLLVFVTSDTSELSDG